MIWKENPEGLSLGETGRSPGPITRLHSTSLLPNLEVTLSRETYRFPLFSLVAQSLQLSSLVICKLSIWKESSIQIFLSCWGIDFSWCCHCWVLYDEISSYLWNFFTLNGGWSPFISLLGKSLESGNSLKFLKSLKQ